MRYILLNRGVIIIKSTVANTNTLYVIRFLIRFLIRFYAHKYDFELLEIVVVRRKYHYTLLFLLTDDPCTYIYFDYASSNATLEGQL